jgi:hypothetical protein
MHSGNFNPVIHQSGKLVKLFHTQFKPSNAYNAVLTILCSQHPVVWRSFIFHFKAFRSLSKQPFQVPGVQYCCLLFISIIVKGYIPFFTFNRIFLKWTFIFIHAFHFDAFATT